MRFLHALANAWYKKACRTVGREKTFWILICNEISQTALIHQQQMIHTWVFGIKQFCHTLLIMPQGSKWNAYFFPSSRAQQTVLHSTMQTQVWRPSHEHEFWFHHWANYLMLFFTITSRLKKSSPASTTKVCPALAPPLKRAQTCTSWRWFSCLLWLNLFSHHPYGCFQK